MQNVFEQLIHIDTHTIFQSLKAGFGKSVKRRLTVEVKIYFETTTIPSPSSVTYTKVHVSAS